jgi:asparagine synthase (glutamine-hydrolysing)
MGQTLAHRGPDDGGLFREDSVGFAMAFRRLAIVDLSPAGHQPMASASGRYTICFNGEVYNHFRIRPELEAAGFRFRGGSDTEVILAAFEHWGIRAALPRFIGMFAMAVWDAETRELTLLRDRLGVKPLYVAQYAGGVAFGSELKAITADPAFDRAVHPDALDFYLRHLYVPAPLSIFRDAVKLPPGAMLTVRDPSAALPEPEIWWSAAEAAYVGASARFTGTPDEAVDELERLLTDAVDLRMRADVPWGALLSGGIDSSAVVALMQARASAPVKTFTIGFDVAEHDETSHARAVAQHLGTDHTELRLTGRDALDVVPLLPQMFDEPLADPSQIPTYLVCRLARQSVTVALTGDGGDELFAGYHRYRDGGRLIARALGVPAPARRMLAAGIRSVSPAGWDRVARAAGMASPRVRGLRLPGQRLHKLAALARAGDEATMYRTLMEAGLDTTALGWPSRGESDGMMGVMRGGMLPSLLDRMQLADQRWYLPDDLLAKVDRASMAVSLEAREPLLDHRLAEFAWRLPPDYRLRADITKWPLRQVLHRYVPQALVERPKMGFTVPIAEWMRGPLREWAGDAIMALGRSPGFARLPSRWDAFARGETCLANGVWAAASLQAWAERWGATDAAIGAGVSGSAAR